MPRPAPHTQRSAHQPNSLLAARSQAGRRRDRGTAHNRDVLNSWQSLYCHGGGDDARCECPLDHTEGQAVERRQTRALVADVRVRVAVACTDELPHPRDLKPNEMAGCRHEVALGIDNLDLHIFIRGLTLWLTEICLKPISFAISFNLFS